MRRPWASEPAPQRGRLWLALVGVVAFALLTWALNEGGGFSGGGRPGDADPELATVALTDLPPAAAATVRLIRHGGRDPFHAEAAVFGNHEGLLPAESSGYYHEYAVDIPGVPDRGARRIVAGSAGELYWTGDDNRTFERITP